MTKNTKPWISDAVKKAEDAKDAAVFEERTNEPFINYDEMVERLKKDGQLKV